MKKNKCLIIENKKFLWWKWQNKYERHEWIYKNKKQRKCKNCGRKEIYFGLNYSAHCGPSEDWRITN